MVRFFLPIILIVALNCRQAPESKGRPFQSTTAHEAVPGRPIALQPGIGETIASAHTIGDVFQVFKFINLEFVPGAEIVEIHSVVFIDGNWFILDSDGEKILRFSEDGQFLGLVGGTGQGPGEFLRPMEINKSAENLLGVWDGGGGSFILYDAEGVFVRELSPVAAFGLYPNGQFIWDEDRLYLADAYTRNQDLSAPRHTIVDLRGKPAPIGGFGKRIPILETYRQKGIPTFGFSCFARFGDRIWTAPPHCADLEVYALDGRFLGRIMRRHPDKLTYDDIEALGPDVDMPPKKFLALLSKARNDRIFQVSNLVLAGLWYRSAPNFDIYDLNGNLLKSGLFLVSPYSFIRGSVDDVLVGTFSVLDNPAFHPQKIFTPEHYQLLLDSGWDPDAPDHNPGLVLGRLNP